MSRRMQDIWDAARTELRYEPLERRVRADDVVDSTCAVLVWEPRRVVPSYAVPAEDIAAPLVAVAVDGGEVAGVLHPGVPFAVHTAAGEPVSIGERLGAGFRLADDDLAGYVALDFVAFEQWLKEDEPVRGHAVDPFHRVDVRRTSRPVRIEAGGSVIAHTSGAQLLFETQLPMRFYVPRADVRAELRPSDRRTYCPFKGEASYWSLDGLEDVAWSYEEPLPGAAEIAGLVAFWDHLVDVTFDGEPRARPGGPIPAALRDEFGV